MQHSDPELTLAIFRRYQELNMGDNSICQDCKAHALKKSKPLISPALPIFHVGKDYANSKVRILFVGKVAYGWREFSYKWTDLDLSSVEASGPPSHIQALIDESFLKPGSINRDRKYWPYIRETLRQVFGDIVAGYNRVCISNFVHCNTGSVRDNLPQKVRDYCISKSFNGFIYEEIELLQPTHMVVFGDDWKYIRHLNLNEKYKQVKLLVIHHPSATNGNLGKVGFAAAIKEFVLGS